MKVVFNCRQMSERGTEIAVFDYARHNEEILGNESVVVYDATNPINRASVVKKFEARFEVVPYTRLRDVDRIVARVRGDVFHALKPGYDDGCIAFDVPTAVHAVFPTKPRKLHGTRAAYISEWLSQTCSGGRIPFVPHMIDLPPPAGDLRDECAIPKDALVVGGYGGADSFDVDCAKTAVRRALDRRPDLHFLFMNFDRFVEHPRARFLPGTTDMARKAAFVDSCDAMLHARRLGESFGMACGEFSIRNKPVLTWSGSEHLCHVEILGDAALVYRDEGSLVDLLLGLDRAEIARKDWDRYSRLYGPAPVMAKFDEVFLKGIRDDFRAPSLYGRLRARYRAHHTKGR